MATEKEVEKKRDRVNALREKLAEVTAPVDTTSENDLTMRLLDREEQDLQARIDEAEATRKARHKDAADPIAFAAALLKRDEAVLAERDQKVADNATEASAPTEARKEK